MATRPTMRSTLEIDALHHHFGQHVVLTDLNLHAKTGERIAIRGPNGSGKTTLLRCIAGTVIPTLGSIRIAGHEAGSLDARRVTGVSLSQERSFYMRLSGRENLLLFARLNGLGKGAAAKRVDETRRRARAPRADVPARGPLLFGQLQQLAFARALVGNPELVLLDEPTQVTGRRGPSPPLGRPHAPTPARRRDSDAPRRGRTECHLCRRVRWVVVVGPSYTPAAVFRPGQ